MQADHPDVNEARGTRLDCVLRIGGEGGEGVISCGELFAQAAARTRYHVLTYITYPSEMRGGFSMIQVRVRDQTIYSMGSELDYLVVFNQQAYERCIAQLRDGGTLIYDPDAVEIGDLEHAQLAPVRLGHIANEETGSMRSKNIVALGMLGYLYGMDFEVLRKLLRDRFTKKGAEIVQHNLRALEAGARTAREMGLPPLCHLSGNGSKEDYMLLTGNQAVALGALAAGCRFVAGYPITPATPIFENLTRMMPRLGGKAIQTEDEIAAISAVIGASFAGEKAMTPTSGPGFQLMGEQLNLASMLELPIVIVNVQRGGPSTGLPTKTEQSDLKYSIYGTAGEAPRAVLAATSVEDCFYQTIRAFNIAELFQMPVILLSDQSIGYRKATVRLPDLSRLMEVDGHTALDQICEPSDKCLTVASRREPRTDELAPYDRFRVTDDGISPIARPGTPGGEYLATGLEHTEGGHADYSPAVHVQMTRKRFKKLERLAQALDHLPLELHGPEDARIGLIGWGSTMGAIREARYLAEQRGVAVKHVHPRVLTPLPERQMREFLAGLEQVIVVEENYTGQFAHFIRAKFGVHPIEIHKYQGVPISPEEILNGILKVAEIIDDKDITAV